VVGVIYYANEEIVSGDWLNRNGIDDLHSVMEKRHGKRHLRSVTERTVTEIVTQAASRKCVTEMEVGCWTQKIFDCRYATVGHHSCCNTCNCYVLLLGCR